MTDAPGFTIRGLSFFAGGLVISNAKEAKVLGNSFAYPTYGKRALIDGSAPSSKTAVSQKELFRSGKTILFSYVGGALIEGNVFNYSEGQAFQVYYSSKTVVRDNLLAWNMINGEDFHTMSFVKGGGCVAEYNTLYFNNGVHGIVGNFNIREYGNWVRYQNFGKLQHDGSALGVGGLKANYAVVDMNWVEDGPYSITARFDAGSGTPLTGTTKDTNE